MRCPSGESWICVGALLGWATATLLVTTRERAVPMNVKHLVFITLNLDEIFCSLKVLVSKRLYEKWIAVLNQANRLTINRIIEM